MVFNRALAWLWPALIITSTFTIRPTPSAIAQRAITVDTAEELKAALRDADPGDTILLADGSYRGRFTATRSGTASAPITLEGSPRAVLDGGSVDEGYGFHLRASHWTLRGFTVTNSSKGIVTDRAKGAVLDGLRIFRIGEEAVHFRTFSSDNVIQNSVIHDTGETNAGFGEGVYIGSAHRNWDDYTRGKPDRSDSNRVINNRFGPNVRAEAVDVKEGTTGGEIRGNTFDGRGLSGRNSADSWVDVKGNDYVIRDNVGAASILHGFETHVEYRGWGNNNRFIGNTANVQSEGYGFYIETGRRTQGNVVYDDNIVQNAVAGLTNIGTSKRPRP